MPGGLGDETLPHLPFPEFSFGVNVNGADEMRKAVRMFLKYGVDSIKLNLSGDNFTPDSPADTTWMTDAEVAAAMEEVRDARQARHRARALGGLGQAGAAPRHRRDLPRQLHRRGDARHARGGEGPRLRRARHRDPLRDAARGRGLRHHAREGASRWATRSSGTPRSSRCKAMHKRGVRVLPGGDYGFAFTPHCQNARDLEFFVKYLGFTPMEAIRCATLYGGQIMMTARRARPGQGRLPRRPAAGRRRPAGQPRDPARPEAHPRGDEGRRVRQGARDRRRSAPGGAAPHDAPGRSRMSRSAARLVARCAGCWSACRSPCSRSGRCSTTRACTSSRCSTA